MGGEMAVGASAEARSRGLRIPDDIAIVGFDDHKMSEMMGLTTIHQPVDMIGALAGKAVLETIRQPDAPVVRQVLDTELIVRSTT